MSAERIARLRGFVTADPGNATLAADYLDALLAAGDLDVAAAEAARLSATLRAPAVLHRSARIALRRGEHATAVSALREALRALPTELGLHADLVFALICARRADEALRALAAVEERWTELPLLLMHKARALHVAGRAADALAALGPLLARDPDDLDAAGLQALLLVDLGELDTARPIAARVLGRVPTQIDAGLAAGACALAARDLSAAAASYTQLCATAPGLGRAWSGLGQVHLLRQALDQAERTLDTAVRHMPDHIGTWHLLAWTRLLRGERASARQAFEHALTLDRNFGESHGGLAVIAALEGDHASAERAAQIALRLDPQSRSGRYARALLAASRGEREVAERLVQELGLEAAPGTGLDPRAIDALLGGPPRAPTKH